MKYEYYILNPSGNITALVIGNIPENDYVSVGDEIMALHPETEQVGFVDFSGDTPYLRMCGGEFCGNATMCTASLFCHLKNIDNCEIKVRVYGSDNPLTVSVTKDGDGYSCRLLMDKPQSIKMQKFEVENTDFELPMVAFKGISHVIGNADFNRRLAEKILKEYSAKLNLSAMGFMLYCKDDNRLNPIVYVKDCDKLFYENSCASGSCAVCAYMTRNEADKKEIVLEEPGGTLKAVSGKNCDFINLYNRVEITGKFIKE